MKIYMYNFLKYKDLLLELVLRDIKVKYKKSILGLFWSLLNPLLMMTVITIVFSNLFKFDIPNFPIYLLTGQIIFGFFSEATSTAMNSIAANANLIKKVYIPKYIFPLSKVLSSFVNLIFSLLAVIIVMLITDLKFSWVVLLFPLSLVLILVFAIGVGLILASFAVFFRDLLHLYGVLLTAWAYLTPIFYPISIIPKEYHLIVTLNPMFYFIEHFRQIVLYSSVPSVGLTFTCFGISICTVIIGLYVFYRKQDRFILYI